MERVGHPPVDFVESFPSSVGLTESEAFSDNLCVSGIMRKKLFETETDQKLLKLCNVSGKVVLFNCQCCLSKMILQKILTLKK